MIKELSASGAPARKNTIQPAWSDRADEPLSIDAAADFSGQTEEAIENAVKNGCLKPVSSDSSIFLKQDVAAWIENLRLADARESQAAGEQIEALLENGFLHIPDALESAELEVLRKASTELMNIPAKEVPGKNYIYQTENASDKKVLERIVNIHELNAVFSGLFFNRHVDLIGKSLIGLPYLVYNMSLVVKIPFTGVPIHVHRDPTWTTRATRDAVFAVAFYLDDSDDKNGGVHFMPKTHRAKNGRATKLPARDDHKWFSKAKCVNARAGDVIIHNLGVIHGSKPNFSASGRRTIYLSLMSEREARQSGRWDEDWISRQLSLLRR